ncbi:MAG TPA: sulfite exporter TauE/SafE family protein [bacterium]|nr:sulfite exporter TauE/SafE family protein [bacterium]HPQ65318.1 sulfite exporter TauE/SafE family protein [bacterium]
MEFIGIAVLAFLAELLDSSMGMGYGTTLSPLLITLGFHPVAVIPGILLSQAFGGFSASVFHHGEGNVTFTRTSRDSKIVFLITVFGLVMVVAGAAIAVGIDKLYLKSYIGVLALVMGGILLSRFSFRFSWRKMVGVGIVSSFNKGITGGGFGPVVTSGQIIAGHDHKSAIGCTTAAEAPICIAGFVTFCLTGSASSVPASAAWRFDLGGIRLMVPKLVVPLVLGALLATPFGARITRRFPEEKIRPFLGVLVGALGLWTLLKAWVPV